MRRSTQTREHNRFAFPGPAVTLYVIHIVGVDIWRRHTNKERDSDVEKQKRFNSLVLRSQGTAFAHDVIMVPIAWYLAYWFRYNLGTLPEGLFAHGSQGLYLIIPVQIGAFVFFGLYRGIWRFASLPDLMRILKAVGVGVAIATTALFLFSRMQGIPRSVPAIYAILLVLLLSGSRLTYRWLKDQKLYLSLGQRVLIVGSGKSGEALVRSILRDRHETYHPVAFVDDDRGYIGRDIHGIPVLGGCNEIPYIAKKQNIDLIMLAVPSATAMQMRRIVELCELSGTPFRSIPKLQDLLSGKVLINELREISIEDLLGRDPISLDWPAIHNHLSEKKVLVTGAGSIGSDLCRQLAKIGPTQLILLDNSEFNLYSIEMELRRSHPDLELHCHLGDVTDWVYVDHVFRSHTPELVFHAAAYKHVPMLEPKIRQALKTNVLGTRTVAQAADRYGAGVFVLVSTDKAVNPANVMGASKRIAEIFCQNFNAHSKTRYITVRFGNVLDSAGSVIPLFRKQIQEGGPVTVTDPRMERYFMTIPEACQLIMQTVVLGEGGEIFVLDMGEPVKITYLAELMIRLSGRIPGEDIKIEYVGLRPGEKLYEELFHEMEKLEKTDHEKVYLARHRKVEWSWLNASLDQMANACDSMDTQQLTELLNVLVPEHQNTATLSAMPASLANVTPLKVMDGRLSQPTA